MNRCQIILSLSAAAAVFAPAARAERPLDLAVRGQAAACAIVTRENPSPVEDYAAEELQAFVERTTGVKLPRQTDVRPIPARAVFVGESAKAREILGDRAFDPKALGEDGFRLAARPPHLVVWGSAKRGALYGVYELLERYAGCRWYASWHGVTPRLDRLSVPAALDDTQTPAFAMREPLWFDMLEHVDFAARNKVNSLWNRTIGAKYGGMPFRFGDGLGRCHTFETLMPAKEFFAAHPEYYSEIKGVRRGGRTQLCLTNPDVLRIVTERVLERIRRDPGAKFYGVSQNDWYNFCECPKCRAVDAEEESHAGTMVRFVNAVAERVEKEFPHAIIETLAYQYTRKPPKKTRLRHNVVPCLCTIECDFARPLDVSAYPQNVRFRKDIEGWAKQTDQLYVWDYVTDFPNFTMPFPNVRALQGNLKFFRANKVREILAQGDHHGLHADFGELKAWLIAKWMWNPDLPAEPLLKDFFEGYYGKGAPFVRAYFDEVHALQIAYSTPANRPLCVFSGPENPALSDAFLEKAAGIWAQAISATKDDPAIAYNVRMGAFGVDYMRLERLRSRYARERQRLSEAEGKALLDRQKSLARSLLDRMAETKDLHLAEDWNRNRSIKAAWTALLAK